jgi:hypothetical protein
VAVDVLGDRADLVVGEAAERVPHQLEVVVEVAGPGAVDRRQERRIAKGRHEQPRIVEGGGVDAPGTLPPVQPSRHVGHRIGGEGARDRCLLVARGAVVEERPGGLDGGGGMGEVVGHDLVGIDRAGGGEMAEGAPYDVAGGLDGGRGGVDVGRSHGWGRYSPTSAGVRWPGRRRARGRSR